MPLELAVCMAVAAGLAGQASAQVDAAARVRARESAFAQTMADRDFEALLTLYLAVEIAYFTYPPFEGRGWATAMARRLIDLARGSPEVRRVIAHTLPEPSASTRVLEKVDMTFVGEVVDPEDGLVWRWHIDIGDE